MKALFDKVSAKCSKYTTQTYSTSFSLGIKLLGKELRAPIYAIYGFVRFADEIVDTFHNYNKAELMQSFRTDTVKAIENKISLNPILNSFQQAVNDYNIEWELIDTFLKSMEMDLAAIQYDKEAYKEYILGSAEVVGLMCLRVFTNGDEEQYQKLKPSAMKLGSAFQKVNFLRDAQADFEGLGRTYFPNVNMHSFQTEDKQMIEAEIEAEFNEALLGIKQLPASSRLGVYIAYVYYLQLLKKIKSLPANRILQERISVTNSKKLSLMLNSYLKHQLNLL